MYTEIITVCCEIYTKHINAICGQKAQFFNVQLSRTYSTHLVHFFFFGATAPPSGPGRFLHHTQRRTLVGRILWTSDQLVAETSTWQHTTLTKRQTSAGIRTHNLSGRAAADLRLRPRGYWRLRHCATSRKVAGSIFHWHNPSGRTMALGSTQPLTEINEYQEYFLESKDGLCVGLTTLPHSWADCLKIWESQPPGTLRACPGQ